MFVFGAINFYSSCKYDTKNRRLKPAPVSGACVMGIITNTFTAFRSQSSQESGGGRSVHCFCLLYFLSTSSHDIL